MKKVAFYPLLMGIYPVLYLYGNNASEVPFSIAVWPLLIALGGTVVVFAGTLLWLRDLRKSALLTSAIAVFFFGYGHIHSLLYMLIMENDIDVGDIHDTIFIFKIILFGVLAFAGLIGLIAIQSKIRRLQPEMLQRLTQVLNVVSIVLVVMPLGLLARHALAHHGDEPDVIRPAVVEESVSPVIKELGYLPDIYNIVLDGYARRDVFDLYYQHDNKGFIQFLRNKGFTVAKRSTANYFWTFLSLASSMNMQYLGFKRSVSEISAGDMTIPFRMIRDHRIGHFLRSRGYRTVHLNSTWGATMTNPYADEEILCSSGVYQTEFYRVLYQTTLLKIWEANVDTDLAECHLTNIETLKKIAQAKGPKFVFAHFVPPHHPYLFDRHGNVMRHATVSNQFEFQKFLWSKFDKYIDQTVYISNRMKEVVNSIQANSKHPPIIIIHSDHGPQVQKIGIYLKDFINARLATFFAAYTPGKPDLFPNDVTAVNYYRLLFNHYFDAGMEVLPAEYIFSSYHQPFKFQRLPHYPL